MPHHLSLELAEPPVGEPHDDASGLSRGRLLRNALIAGGTLSIGGIVLRGLPAMPLADAEARPSARQDTAILNFALLLEYLEAEFYTRAEASGALQGETLAFARVVGEHERAHVAYLRRALGRKAIAKPTFDFKGTTENAGLFRATAVVLEDTGVAAYNGQGPNLRKATLAAAASIVSVEARHAAWIRDIVGKNPAPVAFDVAKTKKQIVAAVGATGFITG